MSLKRGKDPTPSLWQTAHWRGRPPRDTSPCRLPLLPGRAALAGNRYHLAAGLARPAGTPPSNMELVFRVIPGQLPPGFPFSPEGLEPCLTPQAHPASRQWCKYYVKSVHLALLLVWVYASSTSFQRGLDVTCKGAYFITDLRTST